MNEKFGIKNSNKHHNEREKRVPTFSSRFDLSIKIRDDSTWLEQHSRRSIPCPSLSSVTHSRQEDFWIERALVTHPDWPSKRRIYRPRRRRLRFISLHTSDRPYSRSITLSKKESYMRVFTADGEEEKTTAGVVNAKNICYFLTLRLRIWIFSILLVPSARLLKQRSEVSPAS